MALLICRPVCRRSNPEKIRRWIQRLETMRSEHSGDQSALATIDLCIEQARGWI